MVTISPDVAVVVVVLTTAAAAAAATISVFLVRFAFHLILFGEICLVPVPVPMLVPVLVPVPVLA